jgi:ketosteroid isomerase-like protein
MSEAELTTEAALRLAQAWIDAWNRHDLDAILAHYADDARLTSPLVVDRLGRADGTIQGKEALRACFAEGLSRAPGLRFELRRVLVGVDGLAIMYVRESGALVVDALTLGPDGRAVDARVYYDRGDGWVQVGGESHTAVVTASVSSSVTVSAGASAASSGAAHVRTGPPEPTLRELRRVIAVGRSETRGGTEIALLSVELYADAFVAVLRLIPTDGDPPGWNAGPGRPPMAYPDLPVEASDDRGGVYRGRPHGGTSGGGPGNWQWRFHHRFTPALDPAARELRLTVPELRWTTTFTSRGPPTLERKQAGPWSFAVPLGTE